MTLWPWYLCFLFGHGRIVNLDGQPIRRWRDYSGKCLRCGYIGSVNEETGRLFWS